jgi:hypothetical protein
MRHSHHRRPSCNHTKHTPLTHPTPLTPTPLVPSIQHPTLIIRLQFRRQCPLIISHNNCSKVAITATANIINPIPGCHLNMKDPFLISPQTLIKRLLFILLLPPTSRCTMPPPHHGQRDQTSIHMAQRTKANRLLVSPDRPQLKLPPKGKQQWLGPQIITTHHQDSSSTRTQRMSCPLQMRTVWSSCHLSTRSGLVGVGQSGWILQQGQATMKTHTVVIRDDDLSYAPVPQLHFVVDSTTIMSVFATSSLLGISCLTGDPSLFDS